MERSGYDGKKKRDHLMSNQLAKETDHRIAILNTQH